ncbi:MAG: hypothetical protein CR974_03910 [Gammaproteobacteria bacterium]|nr:MAG: hypothetical protein CR974_03910 [Gammaproteobacteria bacterium]
MQVYATKPFSQETWDHVWRDEPVGNEVLVKLDTKNYPIVLTDKGTVTDEWLIVFRGGLQIDLYSRAMGHIMTADWLQDLHPENPAGGHYFWLDKRAFGPTDNPRWPAGSCVRFNTNGALLMPWIIRSVQPHTGKQLGRDGAALCLRGNTSELV